MWADLIALQAERLLANRIMLAHCARYSATVEDELARVLDARALTAPGRRAELSARAAYSRRYAESERALADQYDRDAEA